MHKLKLSPSMSPPFTAQLEVLDAALPYTWELYTNRSDATWNPHKLGSGSQQKAACHCPAEWPGRGHILQWEAAVQIFDAEPVQVRVRATLRDAHGRLEEIMTTKSVGRARSKFSIAVAIE